jgi:hypothetical protein
VVEVKTRAGGAKETMSAEAAIAKVVAAVKG